MKAAKLVIDDGWSTREVARYTGYHQSSVVRWVERARNSNQLVIPTRSSRPLHHPRALPEAMISKILLLRAERNQCAEILQYRLQQDGYGVSLSSVKRVLKRFGYGRYSRWKKWHQYPERPVAEKPGVLVEIDTIHDGTPYGPVVCVYHAGCLFSVRLCDARGTHHNPSESRVCPHRFASVSRCHVAVRPRAGVLQMVYEDGCRRRHRASAFPGSQAERQRTSRTI